MSERSPSSLRAEAAGRSGEGRIEGPVTEWVTLPESKGRAESAEAGGTLTDVADSGTVMWSLLEMRRCFLKLEKKLRLLGAA